MPSQRCDQIEYFIKNKQYTDTPLTPDNLLTRVQYGTVKASHIESLMRVMSNIYAPIFFENTSWPDSIKNDFSAQLHKFLAILTDTRFVTTCTCV